MFTRRTLAIASAGLIAAPAIAQTAWPRRPVRLVVAFPAGGLSDRMGRIVAEAFTAALGQNVIVDNRGGAGGTAGTRQAVAADPDGYTLAFAAPSTHITGPLLYPNPGYDGVTDVVPIGSFAQIGSIGVVHPSVPANSIAELIAHCRAHPGQLNFGSAGSGGSIHLAGELFKSIAGIDIVHVPYRGGAQMLQDLLAGRLQIAFDNTPQILPHIRSGGVRPLAVTTRERSRFTPDLPTMIEAGVPDFEISSWFGVTAPRGTPQEIVDRLATVLQEAVASPQMAETLSVLSAEPLALTGAEFGTFMAGQRERFGEIIRRLGISAAG
ncbi:tripartite tricarboxylate transporter substrate binding protein [Falsiroseomonas sp.]|uniref:Bug family tripartite tricarboxylate transporter substrate binding protein n=1 Tax=Falsiroseomonas sp. TaxID=2870721 RepID=UPI002735BE9C|nr:tripartite tricarboxylate transporter substrate binding protein [Falsiroseomonas sp.]MDP3418685.1 tripartite tricarboxylate transporter substrate binding protein [Falsiroseomonas sp.]